MTNAASHHRPGSCPACGVPAEDDWAHCAWCGWPVAEGLSEVRGRMTVVVTDLQGSTALAERLDAETLRLLLDDYFDAAGHAVAAHGGHAVKRVGDMLVSVFGLARGAGDHADQALRAVAATHQELTGLNEQADATWGVRLVTRTGVATGEVALTAAGSNHRILSGEAVDVAAALEPAAPPLGVLVAESAALEAGDGWDWTSTADVPVGRGSVTARTLEEPARSAAPLAAAAPGECPSCGASGHDHHRCCTACGVMVLGADDLEDRRRYVTVVFVDLRFLPVDGSSAEVPAAVLRGVFERVRSVLERHGGTVERFIGDAVMAVFGLDRRHEDDALRATRAALEVQSELARDAGGDGTTHRLEVRIGVNTGPVVAGDPGADQRLVTGDAVNVAARFEQRAGAGEVVVGELTRWLLGPGAKVDPLEPLVLKGKSEPVPAVRVLSVDDHAAVSSRFRLPHRGRAAQLDTLTTVWDQVQTDQRVRHVELLGDAGTGKTRLLEEFLRLAGDPLVLQGTCPSYGDGVTFFPVAAVVRQAAGVRPGDGTAAVQTALAAASPSPEVAAVLGTLVGIDGRTVPVTELTWAVRRLLDHVAASRPVVVVVDDLHHAAPTLREVLGDLVAHVEGPVLVVTTARPTDAPVDDEDGDDLPTTLHADSLVVEVPPLSDADISDLVHTAVGDALGAGGTRLLVDAAGGLPLFVEQFLSTLVDDGRLAEGAAGWTLTSPLASLDVPPSVDAVVAARLDALPDDARRTAEVAAVVGRTFGRVPLAHLRGHDVGDDLATLSQRDMVEAVVRPSVLADHQFGNQTLRDVAYGGLLKRTRSALHRAHADWLASGPGGLRLLEVEEVVGFHYEQAYLLGTEVGVDSATVGTAGSLAAVHLGASGERAYVRGDMPAAADLLHRATEVLADDPSEASRLLVLAGDASFEQGSFAEARRRYDRAGALAESADDEVRACHARLANMTMDYLVGDGTADAARALSEELTPLLSAHGDDAGVARCWRLRAYVELTLSQWGAAEQAALATLEAARRAEDVALERRVVPALAAFSVHGPTPVPEALARCESLRSSVVDDRRATALIGRAVAHLLALSGDTDRARDTCTEMRDLLVELGWTFDAALVSIDLGPIELMAGRPAAAESALRADYQALHDMGEENYLSTVASLLAEAVRQQGRDDEALELAAESAGIADEDDVASQAVWRSVSARVLRDRGDVDGAAELLAQVAPMVLATDDLTAHGELHADLAELALAVGDTTTARQEATAAADAFRRKGNVPGQRVAADLLGRTG